MIKYKINKKINIKIKYGFKRISLSVPIICYENKF